MLVAWGREIRNGNTTADLPSDYVNARPHGPFEQLDGGRFSNSSCPAHEYPNKVRYAMALRVACADALAGNHLEGSAFGEEVHGIDGRTVSTTQSDAESEGRYRSTV